MAKIVRVWGTVIHDSRGDLTVQASVQTVREAVSPRRNTAAPREIEIDLGTLELPVGRTLFTPERF